MHKVASSPHHAPDQAPEEYQESVKRVARRRATEAFPVRAAARALLSPGPHSAYAAAAAAAAPPQGILDKGAEMWSFPPRHGRRLMQTVWAAGSEPQAPSEEELGRLEAAHKEATGAEGAQEVEVRSARLHSSPLWPYSLPTLTPAAACRRRTCWRSGTRCDSMGP